MNIKEILQNSITKLKLYNISSATLDAEVLLLEALNRIQEINNSNKLKSEIATSSYWTPLNDNSVYEKSWLYAHDNYELTKTEENLFNNFINQRTKHKPVAYIINKKEFFGYEFYINKNVLIPRPETELMVENVLEIINKEKDSENKLNLIDIGTGSGCIIISILNELAKNKKNKIIRNSYANDISSKALDVVKINAEKYKLKKNIKFIANDFENFIKNNLKLFSSQFILTANLPYIKNDEYKNLKNSVKNYEPKKALIGGNDGLGLIKKLINLISDIKTRNNSISFILLEADPDQMINIKSLLTNKLNAINLKIINDINGNKRLILAEFK